MSYPKRTIPPTGIQYDRNWWTRLLDLSQKVAVYWPEGANSITVVGYYDTVSAANTAALGAVSNGQYPRVIINRWHSDFTLIQVGSRSHRDAREDMPAWVDAMPGWQFA